MHTAFNQPSESVMQIAQGVLITKEWIMTAQIKHIAIVTDRYTLLARFYEALFGMWTFPGRVEAAAMAVSDGHVGLNFNLRPPGRQAGLDHFGFEVEDVETVVQRAKEFPGVDFLK